MLFEKGETREYVSDNYSVKLTFLHGDVWGVKVTYQGETVAWYPRIFGKDIQSAVLDTYDARVAGCTQSPDNLM